MCRSCKNAYSWFKIPAMLLACFCLLMWLSLVGRRAYLRRVHLPSVRGACCSLTDLDYMNNNNSSNSSRAYIVRLPPRSLTGPRLAQEAHRVLLTPSRSSSGRNSRLRHSSPQHREGRHSSNTSGSPTSTTGMR
ncbi:unnamed protein product [Echinostoma caproni]|uniref:ORF4 n=1 Tax=Echinostoma caproni TaxID=27848 RepID=A0A183AUC1_9TREM|nr:unnamed protein product [Echinostoma caproni]